MLVALLFSLSFPVFQVQAFTTFQTEKDRKNCPGYSECLTEFPRPYGPGEQPGKYTYTQSLPKFSEGFLWGMGTAAYQVEGSFKSANRGASIWDTFVGANTTGMPGSACSRAPCAVNSLMAAKGATGNVATNQYKNFRSDVAAMAAIGVPLYRFSVSWPRVIPTGNISEGISWKGLSYYHELVDELLANGIEPMVTLYHWDLPQALLDANHERAIQPCDPRHKQGWFECRWRDGAPEPSGLSSAIAQHFTDFAKLVFSELGPKVRRFATFNEPLTFCWNGAGNGHAPSVAPYIGMPWPMVAAHNVLLSHAAASAALRDMRDRHPELSGAEVGIVLNSDWMEPWSSSPQDISAADLAMQQSLGVFASPLLGPDGDYPNPLKRTLGSLLPQFSAEEKALFVSHRPDFLGLNNYATKFVEACPWSEAEGRFKCPGERGGVNWTGRVLALVNGTLQAVALTRTDGLLRAQSKWQFVAAWGIRKLLNYVHRSYRPRSIIVTENGMAAAASDPEEARSDAQRTAYLFSYLTEINNAVHVDKVPVNGYIAWSLLDNFEWSSGYEERFGLLFSDYRLCRNDDMHARCDEDAPGPNSPVYDPSGKAPWRCGAECAATAIPSGTPAEALNQTRHLKNSALYLSRVWASRTVADPTELFFAAGTRGASCWGGPGPEGVVYSSGSAIIRCRGSASPSPSSWLERGGRSGGEGVDRS